MLGLNRASIFGDFISACDQLLAAHTAGHNLAWNAALYTDTVCGKYLIGSLQGY